MKANSIILWILAGGGTFLLYAAITGITPASLLASSVTPSVSKTKIGAAASSTSTAAASPSTSNTIPSPVFITPNGTTKG